MGLGGENENGKVTESLDVCKSKGRKKKKKQDGVVQNEEETGCWLSFRFIGSCISSRSKVDSSVSGTSTNYGNFSIFHLKNYSSYVFGFGISFVSYCAFVLFKHLNSGWYLKRKVTNFGFL